MLTLPLPLLCWPIIVALCSLFGGFFGFAIWAYLSVFEDGKPLLGGLDEFLRWAAAHIAVFRGECRNLASELCDRFRDIPAAWDGRVYDIPVGKVFIGIGLIAWGTLVGTVGVVLLTGAKLVPILVCALLEWMKAWAGLDPMYWLGWLLAPVIVVIVTPAVYVVVMCGGVAYIGGMCALEALRSGSMRSGFLEVFRVLREFDEASTSLIELGGGAWPSCVPRVPDRADRRAPNPFVQRPAPGALERVWDDFFGECAALAKQAVADGWLTEQSCEVMDPAAIIGIPALCALNVLHRSVLQAPKKARICWASHSCDEATRPRDGIADTFWPRVLAAKKELARRMPLTDAELLYLRVRLCSGGGEIESLGQGAQAVLQGGCPRWASLQKVATEVTRLSLQVSRLRAAKDRFPSVLAIASGRAPGRSSAGPAAQCLGREPADPAGPTAPAEPVGDTGTPQPPTVRQPMQQTSAPAPVGARLQFERYAQQLRGFFCPAHRGSADPGVPETVHVEQTHPIEAV